MHWQPSNSVSNTSSIRSLLLRGHNGAQLAPIVEAVINEYNNGNKLGAFQIDKEDSNDTCLNALAVTFGLNKDQVRLRC